MLMLLLIDSSMNDPDVHPVVNRQIERVHHRIEAISGWVRTSRAFPWNDDSDGAAISTAAQTPRLYGHTWSWYWNYAGHGGSGPVVGKVGVERDQPDASGSNPPTPGRITSGWSATMIAAGWPLGQAANAETTTDGWRLHRPDRDHAGNDCGPGIDLPTMDECPGRTRGSIAAGGRRARTSDSAGTDGSRPGTKRYDDSDRRGARGRAIAADRPAGAIRAPASGWRSARWAGSAERGRGEQGRRHGNWRTRYDPGYWA